MEPNPTAAVNPSQASIDQLGESPDDDPIAMLNLLSFSNTAGPIKPVGTGEVELDLAAAGPGLVSDGRWDQLRLVRHPSISAHRGSNTPRSGGDSAVSGTLRLLAQPGAL